MSSTPSSRGSSRGTQQPTTPDQARPTITRTGSFSVAPKSEYLRNALQARRAQNTPTPSPLETRPPPPPAAKSDNVQPPEISPDIFAEFALTEEQTAPVSPIHRRRPSDVGPPRSKTSRELTLEIEKLKDSLMTSSMRVELLRKDNSKIQHELTKTKEQLDQLEPLKEENRELEHENHHLRRKVEHMEEEILGLKESNDDIRIKNDGLVQIATESAEHWSDQLYAIDEAAECIIKLEEEKAALSNEFKQLMKRVLALENNSCTNAHALTDSSPGRYPSRVFSVDESRPSTSHFDSDYYSQAEPDSPQVQASKESMSSITPSERSKKFLDLTEERRQSAQDLVKRMSAASLKALSLMTTSDAPEVPQIPAAFRQQAPKIHGEDSAVNSTPQTPGRYRKGRQIVPQSLLELAQASPVHSATTVSQSPAAQPEGLRGLYRPSRPKRSRTSNDLRPSSHVVTPTNPASTARRQPPVADASPRVLSHGSSKRAEASTFSEHLQHQGRYRRQSMPDMDSAESSPDLQGDTESSEWASLAPPPSVSGLSDCDLTTEVDPREDRDRWWRSIDRLTLPQVLAQSQMATQQATPTPAPSQRTLEAHTPHGRVDEHSNAIKPSRSGERRSRTTPTTPYQEKDFFFNGAEDEDTFMRKAKARMGSIRRQSSKNSK